MTQLDLVGTAEIERDFGVPRYRVHRLAKRGLWPEPVAVLAAGGIWRRRDVERTVKKLKAQGLL